MTNTGRKNSDQSDKRADYSNAEPTCGPDTIPGEVFQNCESTARDLYDLLKLIWTREYVPPALVRDSFIMLYKNKGSVNDPSKYRYIGLLPHTYKILSLIMLERITKECAKFLSD